MRIKTILDQQKRFSNKFSLIKVRIVFLLIAWLHLIVTAVVTLSIDTRVDEDPFVQAYYYVRWKLITCWFNLITLVYLPTRLYCDWRNTLGDRKSPLVVKLYHYSDVVMTSILFPVTLYSDITFWYLFITKPALLAPPQLWNYLPYWAQHSLHTVSAVVVLLDLVLSPRLRPTTLKPRIGLLLTFFFAYILVVYRSRLQGELVYACIKQINTVQFIAVALVSLTCTFTLFSIQWIAIELLWGKKTKKEKML